LSSADPGRPIDWETESRWQAARNRPAVYSAALVGVHDDAGHLAAAHRHRHGQRPVGQLGVVMLAQREPEDPAGGRVQDAGQLELALIGGYLRPVAIPFLVDLSRREVAFHPVRSAPAAPARPGGGPAPALSPGGQVLLAHQRGDGVLAHPPPRIPQVRGDPRGAALALMQVKQPPDLGREASAPGSPRR